MYVIQVRVLAKLEVLLPVYWNTSTRHFLLHTFDFIRNLGHFWAFSMLGVERLHVMVKRLGKSKRNIMKSIQTHNDDYITSQLQWRHNGNHKWVNKQGRSSFQMKQPIPLALGIVEPTGAMTNTTADALLFRLLEDEWAVKNTSFENFRYKYRAYARNAEQKKKVPVAFRHWQLVKNRKNTKVQRRWQSMSNKIWTLKHCKVDGVLFRTKPSQDRKKTKTDNSCMAAEVNVTDEHGMATTTLCYGVIKELYFHFMYPPEKSTYKLTAKKLKNFDEPWIVVALCDWYEEVGIKVSTGLKQIAHNAHWEGCPISNMANTMAENFAFWPSCPFNPDNFDDDGVWIHDGLPTFSGTGVFDVVSR